MEGAVDVMAALKRKLQQKSNEHKGVTSAYLNRYTYNLFSPSHTLEGVCPDQMCHISVEDTHTRQVRKLKSPIDPSPHTAGTYQKLSAFLHLQHGLECGGAQAILLLPAKGGRDVKDTGCTLGTPRETCFIELECRGEPNICGICGGC